MREVTVNLRLTQREFDALVRRDRVPAIFCEAAAYEAIRKFMLTVSDFDEEAAAEATASPKAGPPTS